MIPLPPAPPQHTAARSRSGNAPLIFFLVPHRGEGQENEVSRATATADRDLAQAPEVMDLLCQTPTYLGKAGIISSSWIAFQ